MARETGSTPTPRPRHRRNGSCFFWFLTGGLLGALAVAIAWMTHERGTRPEGATVAANPRPAQAQPKLRYDYPTILPELEVVVPDHEMDDPNRPPALPPPPGTQEAAQDAAKGTGKEAAKGTGKETAKTASKEPGKTPAKEPAKAPAKEATKPPAKEAPKEAGKAPIKEAPKEAGKSPAKEATKEPAKAAEAVKEPAKTPAPTKAATATATDKTAAPAKEAETPASGDGETYILQVASLATPAEAEQFKAKLAAQGISASIQQATIDGKTRYRIRTGPLKGKEATNKARAQLASKGYQAMTIKLK